MTFIISNDIFSEASLLIFLTPYSFVLETYPHLSWNPVFKVHPNMFIQS